MLFKTGVLGRESLISTIWRFSLERACFKQQIVKLATGPVALVTLAIQSNRFLSTLKSTTALARLVACVIVSLVN
jgi:hypothetical protein